MQWSGPYGGVPPLGGVRVEDFEPALADALAAHRLAVEAILVTAEPPTFDNTVVALERADDDLDQVKAVYRLWRENHSSSQMREVRRRVEPQLAAHRDAIRQDPRLIERLQPLEVDRDGLQDEEKRLLGVLKRRFIRAGAQLDVQGRERLAGINTRLSELFSAFDEHVLEDEERVVCVLTADQRGGLSQSWLDAAALAARERDLQGWVVLNTRSSAQPLLETSTDRDLRETVWRAFTSRGVAKNPPVIQEILTLRTERAQLLGYATASHMLLSETMAKDPEAARSLLDTVWKAAKRKYADEEAAMRAWAADNGLPTDLEPWDVRFLQARVEAANDVPDLTPWLGIESLREGMFWMAGQLYGWHFEPADIPLPHPDVRAWEVHDSDGVRGIWVLDPFARPGKRSGAWMTAWRVQSALDGERTVPLISNNENYLKAPSGETRLSWDDATTLFHEFGHAMHGLASNVRFPTLAGTAVSRDFVEFPSQLAEHWLATPELLQRFARNEANEPLPEAWIAQITKAEHASSGFRTVEFVASALVDIEIHQQTEQIDPIAFQHQVLERVGLPASMCMRHALPHFGHLFSSDGYASSYYSYLWADVLVADAAEAFAETGFYDTTLAKRYHDTVLSRGNTVDPAEAFRAFLGRDPEIGALLRSRGLSR